MPQQVMICMNRFATPISCHVFFLARCGGGGRIGQVAVPVVSGDFTSPFATSMGSANTWGHRVCSCLQTSNSICQLFFSTSLL